MIEITIYLKNGVSFSVFVNEFNISKTGVGNFVGVKWKDAALTLPHLLHVDVDSIAAIVSTQHPEKQSGTPA